MGRNQGGIRASRGARGEEERGRDQGGAWAGLGIHMEWIRNMIWDVTPAVLSITPPGARRHERKHRGCMRGPMPHRSNTQNRGQGGASAGRGTLSLRGRGGTRAGQGIRTHSNGGTEAGQSLCRGSASTSQDIDTSSRGRGPRASWYMWARSARWVKDGDP